MTRPSTISCKKKKNIYKSWPFLTSKLNYSKKKRSLTWNSLVLFLPLQSQEVGNFSFSERTLAFNIFRRERYIIKIPWGEKKKSEKSVPSTGVHTYLPQVVRVCKCKCSSTTMWKIRINSASAVIWQAHDKASWQWSPLKRIYSNRIGPEEGTFQRHLSHFLSSNFLEVPQG